MSKNKKYIDDIVYAYGQKPIKPPAYNWKIIERKLNLIKFFQFRWSSFNIYYIGVITTFFTSGFFYIKMNQNIIPAIQTKIIQQHIIDSVESSSQVQPEYNEEIKNNNQNHTHIKSLVQEKKVQSKIAPNHINIQDTTFIKEPQLPVTSDKKPVDTFLVKKVRIINKQVNVTDTIVEEVQYNTKKKRFKNKK